MSIEFVTETLTPSRVSSTAPDTGDGDAYMIDIADMQSLVLEVVTAVMANTKKLCTERWGTDSAPAGHRRFPKRHPNQQPQDEVGGWIVEDIIGTRVRRSQFKNMVADTIAAHITRVIQREPNGEWRVESIVPVMQSFNETMPPVVQNRTLGLSPAEVDMNANVRPGGVQKRTKLLLRTVYVDLAGAGWIVRKDGKEEVGTSDMDATGILNTLVDAIKGNATKADAPAPAKK